jgi:hypothetical protein
LRNRHRQPLDKESFAARVTPSDSFIQLVGVSHPSPKKGDQFRAIDLVSIRASVSPAVEARIQHFVYVSVAQPAMMMKDYIAVRAEGESLPRTTGLNATILRPWYVLGPGHRSGHAGTNACRLGPHRRKPISRHANSSSPRNSKACSFEPTVKLSRRWIEVIAVDNRHSSSYGRVMRPTLICLLLPLLVLSCSKNASTAGGSQSQNQSTPSSGGLPFTVTVVVTPEVKEANDISNQVASLLVEKKYDDLDALAKKLRDSKEGYADGSWKLASVYDGLEPADEAPDAEWTARFMALRDWIKSKPESITPRVAMARDLVSYGWKARGSDYANKVSQTGWKLLFQRLNEAVTTLNSAKTLKEQCPVWWSTLMQAELGLQVKRAQYDATFAAATKAWPDYTTLYFRRANYLLPRWYGTPGEWESDLVNSADKIGGEGGDMLYAQVVWDMHQSIDSTNMFQEYHLSWNRVKSGFESIEKHFPDSLARKNEAAHLAVLGRDGATAKKYFDQTAGQVDLKCWDSKDDFVEFANMIYGVGQ